MLLLLVILQAALQNDVAIASAGKITTNSTSLRSIIVYKYLLLLLSLFLFFLVELTRLRQAEPVDMAGPPARPQKSFLLFKMRARIITHSTAHLALYLAYFSLFRYGEASLFYVRFRPSKAFSLYV